MILHANELSKVLNALKKYHVIGCKLMLKFYVSLNV